MEMIIFEPIFKHKIWGGDWIAKNHKYVKRIQIEQKVGEVWLLSGTDEDKTLVEEGQFKGYTINQLLEEKSELFGNRFYRKFPAIMKIIDAKEHLSIQIHPAKSDLCNISKSECWYIIDCDEKAEVVIGHKALQEEEFLESVTNGTLEDILIKKYIKPGDFVYVPAGTIHAIRGGSLILEISEPDDVTYRIYDYGRKSESANHREINIEKAMESMIIPHREDRICYEMSWGENLRITNFIENRIFFVQKWENRKSNRVDVKWNFALVYCLDGFGRLNGKKIEKGETYLLTFNIDEISLEGDFTFIISRY